MEVSEGQCQAATDKQGRAFFGDVGLVEGSGRVQQDENLPDGGAVGGLECLLVAAAGSGRGRSGCDGVCLCVWASSQVQPVVEVTVNTDVLAAGCIRLRPGLESEPCLVGLPVRGTSTRLEGSSRPQMRPGFMLQAASQAKWTGLCCRQLMNRSGRCGGWPSMSVQVLPDDTPHDGCAAPCRRQLASWECPVLFSDDAAKFAALQQLNGQQQALQARRQEVEYALQDADKVGRPACGHRCLWVRLRREALLMCSLMCTPALLESCCY